MVQILRDVARDRERPEGESTASEVGYGPTGFASGPTQPRRGGYAAGSVEPSEETAQPAMASLNSAVSTGSGAPAVPTASGHASDRPPPGQTLKVRILDSQSNVIAVTSVTLETALGSPFVVQDWYALNHNMFAALNLQKLALVIILTLIVMSAYGYHLDPKDGGKAKQVLFERLRDERATAQLRNILHGEGP